MNTEGVAYEIFMNSIKSKQSRTVYRGLLLRFARWMNVASTESLLKYALQNDARVVKADIISYLMHLKNDIRLSHSSRNTALAAIKHFFEMNEVVLPWKQIAKFLGEKEKVYEDREYTYEEIRRLLNIADIKYKAIILLLASSGTRVGGIPSIKIGHISKVSDFNIFKISIYKKSKEEYYTFCTPECYKAIMDYLDYRTRFGEVLVDDAPLFRKDFDRVDRLQVRNPQPIGLASINGRFRKLLIQSGVARHELQSEKNKGRRNEVARAHGFRKFAITNMGRSRMDSEIREMLAGHKLGIKGLYLKYGEQDRLTEYLKAVDFLTINQENRLKVENLKIKQRNEILERDREDVISLRKELEPLLALKGTLIKEGLLEEA
jgi:integrase